MDSEKLTSAFIKSSMELKRFLDNLRPDGVTDEEVTKWLHTAKELLGWAREGVPVDLGPDRSQPDNLRMKYKIEVRSILRRASWLGEETRATLLAFVDEPPTYIQRGKYRLSYDSFSARAPRWEIDLAPFAGQPDLQFLEVGSFEGYSACWLMDNVLTQPNSYLTCVDPFQKSKELFEHNVGQTGASERVMRVAGYSHRVLPTLTPEHYHFIYLDASHQQINTLEDAVLAWRLLRRDGLMTFDDYLLKDSRLSQLFRHERPDIAIDAFLRVYEGRYKVLHRGYHVTVRKL